jgi:hypothetical protein
MRSTSYLKKLVRKKSPNIITPELIRDFHKMTGENIGASFGGNPGVFRRKNVIAGNVYRPPSYAGSKRYNTPHY